MYQLFRTDCDREDLRGSLQPSMLSAHLLLLISDWQKCTQSCNLISSREVQSASNRNE
jgi:hypothetical protein